jgi:hypothetical protein
MPNILTAQTVELSTRVFWLGERPDTLDSFPPFIAVNRIDWIEDILQHDPALKDAVFHIDQAFYSVRERFSQPDDGEIRLYGNRVPLKFVNPSFEIYGSPTVTSSRFRYMPLDPSLGFSVSCTMQGDRETPLPDREFSLCVVHASYARDDAILLQARLYFPPNPEEAPDYFGAVAQRMREIARCLDVTEISQNASNEPPDLNECGVIAGT